ncbi:MAG: serine/threonine-protein kinase HipA [Sphingomonadales bacterium]|jgi:serine/threonine-protein kinase HipA|nr:serine/threonine-protein kinase HipA [Sphingomonadales bacterium]
MTSNEPGGECYVYITLPGDTRPVTAGRYALTVTRRGDALGRFVYGRNYLQMDNAVEIDPFELKLAARNYETVRLKGVFGALRDSGPDFWGRRVIEKHRGKAELSELDYLLHSADDRAGALGFGRGKEPPAPTRKFNKTLELAKLQKIADAILADEEVPQNEANAQIEELLLVGTSMGGARPKAVVEDEAGLWLAKFNRGDDPWNVARVEHAMLTLARACGLDVALSQVVRAGGRDVLLVRRFDREKIGRGYVRARMVSALTMLRAEDSHRSRDRWSYVLLAEELRRISGNARADAHELFRRMAFNALISNSDDHPRNHAILARGLEWRLSPAYDLTPTSPIGIERRDLALTVGDQGRRASADNLVSQSARFLLTRGEAEKIVDDMEAQVKTQWYDVARAQGVSPADCERIKGAFAYPGFRLIPDAV